MEEINDDWLSLNLPKYDLLGKCVTFILENLLQKNNIDYLSVSYRTKTKEGIYEKIKRKNYLNPKVQLTDFSGIRIILYFESDIIKVCELINSTFSIDTDNSVDNETRLSIDKIGYRSIHYVCDVGPTRKGLAEYEYIANLKFEIQVRTMLQHAWAELTHDRNYKLGINLPLSIERKINLYSGMLELADQGFSEIIASINKYRVLLKSENLLTSHSQTIDSISLIEFTKQASQELDIHFEELGVWAEKYIDDVIQELRFMEISTFSQLKDLIPQNYAKVFREYREKSNGIGFIRDLLLIKDFRRLRECPGLDWGILDNPQDGKEIKIRTNYYSNFMNEDDAQELIKLFG
ncbi:RelA/SpoT domain-containing protein [Leclercia adecarboxylata]|uniref:GTP pyrophosphokinase n=1 Tax=Leclercia adecarboxylata TaxID=83655 RepID=UPI0030194C0F